MKEQSMPATWTEDRAHYEKLVAEIEPAARLVTKDSWIWPALWWAAVVLTLGLFALGMKKRVFLEQFATTLFPIQGYPSKLKKLSIRLVVHECRHTTHCVWLGYLIPILGWIPGYHGRHIRAWCGAPFYTVLYLVAVLPTVLAVGRWLIELDCDKACWRWQVKHNYKVGEIVWRASNFGAKVCSGRYFWAWLKVLGGVRLFVWQANKVVRAA